MRITHLKRKDSQAAVTLLLVSGSKARMNLIPGLMMKMKVKRRMMKKMSQMEMLGKANEVARLVKEAEAVAAIQESQLPHKPNHRAGDGVGQRRVTALLQVHQPKASLVRRVRLGD